MKIVRENIEFDRDEDMRNVLGVSIADAAIKFGIKTWEEGHSLGGEWKNIESGSEVRVEFNNGHYEIFSYEDEDSELDYHSMHGDHEGKLFYGSHLMKATFLAYSQTGNPDDPQWVLDIIEEIEPKS